MAQHKDEDNMKSPDVHVPPSQQSAQGPVPKPGEPVAPPPNPMAPPPGQPIPVPEENTAQPKEDDKSKAKK